MATGYIVWDSKRRQMVGGPFSSSAEATKAVARMKTDGAETSNKSKPTSSQYTVETVTFN